MLTNQNRPLRKRVELLRGRKRRKKKKKRRGRRGGGGRGRKGGGAPPRMYPLSLTDCSVGRFMRNFISLVRTLFGSVSPAELDEWLTLGLAAATKEDHLETGAVFRPPGQKADIGGATHACVCPRRFRTCLLAPRPDRRSSRTSLRPPRRSGAPDTPEEQQQRLVQATGPTAHV